MTMQQGLAHARNPFQTAFVRGEQFLWAPVPKRNRCGGVQHSVIPRPNVSILCVVLESPPIFCIRPAYLCYVRQSPTAIAGRLLLILQWILLPVRPDARSAEWVGERANPALKYPKLSKEGGLKPEDRALLAERLELILRVAVHKGHDVVVLGAMG